MNTNTIRKAIAAVTLTAALVGCSSVSNGSTTLKPRNYNAPRGQIGHTFAVKRSDAPRGQIGRTYAVNTIRVREHILSDTERCV